MTRSSVRRAATARSSDDDATGRPARRVRSSGRRNRSRSSVPATYDVEDLAAAVRPLLELFSMLDAVFTEDDALTVNKKVSLGRCYEAWQACRKAFDPTFVASEHRRPRKWVPRR